MIYTLVVAIVLAVWEIQIEGENGWAGKLPTWRCTNKLISKLLGGRPLTGYHLMMWIFLLMIIHLPCFFTHWNWRKEMLIVGFFFTLVTLEDFFWFVFNPAFGIKKFRSDNLEIWWYRRWWLGVPNVYWLALMVITICFYFGLPTILKL
ncbi:MAG: hypothetical protein ACP5IX_00045 [Patescibacteria group bacterium]